MTIKIADIAERIKSLRETLEFSVEEMAKATDTSITKYLDLETGTKDFSFTFLLKCSDKFGVEMSDLLTGNSPKLNIYEVCRNGEGLPIKRRESFNYQHLAYLLKNKLAEPFKVIAPYIEEIQGKEIEKSTHAGNEFDYILSGSLKVVINDKVEILNAGDSVFYDSINPHGMIAIGGLPCEFLAVVIKGE